MKVLISFLVGVIVGAAAHMYFSQSRGSSSLAEAGENAKNQAVELGRDIKEKLNSPQIKEELEKTGKVIREKARQAGAAIADATANGRISAAVKAKLVQDAGLAGLKIDVDTTDGVVTLSGTVGSHEAIERAMELALETDGVHKVVSTLQVKNP